MSRQYRIAIVGECWGAEEAQIGMPLVGAAGRELNRMLDEAGINRPDCYVTCVFNQQPQNNVNDFGVERKAKLSTVPMPDMTKGLALKDEYYPEVKRLWKELEEVKPNVVLALGNTALWALTGNYGIRKLRGTTTEASYGPRGMKIVPTYAPNVVFGDWSLRSVVVADLMKLNRQSHFPEIRRPKRELWLEPSLNHIELFFRTYVLGKCKKLSFDIETAGATQITCVGFAPSPSHCIVIPFVDNRQPSGSYWATPELEREAWKWVARYLAHEESEKLGQNTLYDINWLWTKLGITPKNYRRDTMLKHHAMNPEFEKGLGFLGSVYTDEPAWKTMRNKGMFTIKRGE